MRNEISFFHKNFHFPRLTWNRVNRQTSENFSSHIRHIIKKPENELKFFNIKLKSRRFFSFAFMKVINGKKSWKNLISNRNEWGHNVANFQLLRFKFKWLNEKKIFFSHFLVLTKFLRDLFIFLKILISKSPFSHPLSQMNSFLKQTRARNTNKNMKKFLLRHTKITANNNVFGGCSQCLFSTFNISLFSLHPVLFEKIFEISHSNPLTSFIIFHPSFRSWALLSQKPYANFPILLAFEFGFRSLFPSSQFRAWRDVFRKD